MNRYPVWKYVIIAFALLFGTLYTVPNFYGESPAVQVSPERSANPASLETLKQVEKALADAKLGVEGVFLDGNSVKARFKDTDTQLKARDVLQNAMGSHYIVALNLLSSTPEWLTRMNSRPMFLGLDLRGGVHFLLQIDMKAAMDKTMERYAGDIRRDLRDKKIRDRKSVV